MKLPLQDFRANALMTAEVLEALRMCAPACSFILLSSAAVYGSPDVLPISESTPAAPISAYGFHKHMAEQLCGEYAKLHGLRTACVRIFSAYGPGLQRQVLWDLCRKIMSGDALVLQGTGEESRDFVHARDIARAILTVVASAPLRGECYNIGSGVETPIASLAQMLVTALQESRSIAFDGVLPAGTPVRWQADVAKLKALGFVPEISIERGVHDYAAWARPFLTKR
jgi:UDP-glucose 4-epimerase